MFRSYQEKHLLLTEIQVMKDQLKQWHREKGKDRLESANGPAIGSIAILLDSTLRYN